MSEIYFPQFFNQTEGDKPDNLEDSASDRLQR